MSLEETTATRDSGLFVLVSLLCIQGIGADPAQIRHRFGNTSIGIFEMLRCATDFGLRARERKVDWQRLLTMPLPAIAAPRDGCFLLVAKAGEKKILALEPYGSWR